jgi:hypothetical protein
VRVGLPTRITRREREDLQLGQAKLVVAKQQYE